MKRMDGKHTDFRRIQVAWMYLCFACCVATLGINEIYLDGSARGLLVIPVFILLMLLLARLCRSALWFELIWILGVGLSTAVCFSVQATLVRETDDWFLPIGLVVTLSMATLFDHAKVYCLGSALIWCCTFLIVTPAYPGGVETAYASLMCAGSILVAVVLCHIMSTTRRENSRLLMWKTPCSGRARSWLL